MNLVDFIFMRKESECREFRNNGGSFVDIDILVDIELFSSNFSILSNKKESRN